MSQENQPTSSQHSPEVSSQSDIVKAARTWAIIGNAIGVFFCEMGRIAPQATPNLNAEVLPVIGAGFFILTALAYFAGINSNKINSITVG